MKTQFFVFLIISFILFCSEFTQAQQHKNIKELAKDTTPIENLDYDLSKSTFLNYYGIDDTSKALIHLFFRKRTNSVVNFCVPTGCLTLLLGVGSAGIIDLFFFNFSSLTVPIVLAAVIVVFASRSIIQQVFYSRQALLYTLVQRERGKPIPKRYLENLTYKDFVK